MQTFFPKISVCIPVFSTEPLLAQCLRSVIVQDFDSFEVVVVSDSSRGKDENGRSAKKIVKLAQKECDRFRKERHLPCVPFKFVEHHENRGILEVRRTLVYEASGSHIFMVDSDDVLEDGALSALFSESNSFDIIQGGARAGRFDFEGNFVPEKENRFEKIVPCEAHGHDIFHEWISQGKISGHLWAKLIKRELFEKAFENIPYTECNMADDFLIFFFVSLYAQNYVSLKNKVYRYRISSGMSSTRKIDTLHKWKMVCSAASVFTVISTWIEEYGNKLQKDEVERIRAMTRYYLANNLRQMHETVIPELKNEARKMLCEYWGESFVEKIEAGLAAGLHRN